MLQFATITNLNHTTEPNAHALTLPHYTGKQPTNRLGPTTKLSTAPLPHDTLNNVPLTPLPPPTTLYPLPPLPQTSNPNRLIVTQTYGERRPPTTT